MGLRLRLGSGLGLGLGLRCTLAAFWCERALKASWSAREMPKRSASRSALCPITSPVSMFAMAGVSGARCESLRPLRMDLSLPIGALIFCERMSFLRIGRLGAGECRGVGDLGRPSRPL